MRYKWVKMRYMLEKKEVMKIQVMENSSHEKNLPA